MRSSGSLKQIVERLSVSLIGGFSKDSGVSKQSLQSGYHSLVLNPASFDAKHGRGLLSNAFRRGGTRFASPSSGKPATTNGTSGASSGSAHDAAAAAAAAKRINVRL